MVKYEILYNSINITSDISNYLTSITYTDHTAGESDELSIDVEDSSGLWSGPWYPEKGANLSARFLMEDGRVLNCGDFTLDELTGKGDRGSGNTMTIKALAAGINQSIRTRISYAHENKTLRQIAQTIATKYGFTIVGSSIPEIPINRVTQKRETPLHFLARLAAEYGLAFSVKGSQLVFTSIFELEAAKSVMEIYRNNVTNWEITDKTANTYLQANTQYHSAKKKKVIGYTSNNNEIFSTPVNTKRDYINIRSRTENEQQAAMKSKVALYRANTLQREGHLTLPGDPLLVAGVNIFLPESDWRTFFGNYHVITSTHTVTRSGGYTANLDIKGVGTK